MSLGHSEGRKATAGYRAVLFDFGGTLFSYRPFRQRFSQLLVDTAAEHGVDVGPDEAGRAFRASSAAVHARYLRSPRYLHRDLFGELGTAFIEQFGLSPREGLADRFYRGQTDVALPLIAPRPETRDVLEQLRALGLHLGVVSNIDDDQFEELWAACRLDDFFDAITTSESAASCKPDRKIFEEALHKAGGVDPREVVFVGDSLHHDVVGAQGLGMTTVLLAEISPSPLGGGGQEPEPTLTVSDLRGLLPLFGVAVD